ncbi:hypothetical protein CJ205_02320 [Dolosicoccus paucivorans]|uniref:DUF1129 domain-containing protein n=1 Tax=Dolosicoccus paucivorans TaxID=84521 RepID=A0A2N6SNV3_9LACT|nr:DUF1129 family protein [Dolosicoccus paucivorans]PMB84756.1 hypothetical protein CJ206_02425 [Dolosicoccus paucivorans]PMC58774.1 hypothetical protein CJ205_02320 [Dolosicoccus paucivorans]
MTDLEKNNEEFNEEVDFSQEEKRKSVEATLDETIQGPSAPSEFLEEQTVHSSVTSSKEIVPGVSGAEFNNLTRKNRQFLITTWRQVKAHGGDEEAVAPAFNEVYETLLAGQKISETAQQIYGTPTEVAQTMLGLDRQEEQDAKDNRLEAPSWMVGVDGALLMGSIYTLLTGVAHLRGNQGTPMGLITLVINYILAGFATTIMAKYLPNMDAPRKERGYLKYTLASVGAMLVWIMTVSASILFLPPAINPLFSPMFYIVLGLVGLAGRYILRQRYRIEGGLF